MNIKQKMSRKLEFMKVLLAKSNSSLKSEKEKQAKL